MQAQEVTEWPDGTVSGQYGFRHALYQHVLQDRIGEVRRIRLHRQIGLRKEEGYGERTEEIAGELAVHFEHARDYPRAVKYLYQAGQNAVARSAYVEAINHLTRALELLKLLPDTPDHVQQEVALQLTWGSVLIEAKGFADPTVQQAYSRALELCQRLGETPQLFSALGGLVSFYLTKAEYKTTHELLSQCRTLAQLLQNVVVLTGAYRGLGACFTMCGEFVAAVEHFDRAMAFYDA